MSDSRSDEVLGRVKTTVAGLMDDVIELRHGGWTDQLSAMVRCSAERLADKVEQGLDAAKEQVQPHRP